MKANRTNLYLIRHGEAVVNVQPIVGGMKGDKGLTTQGITQAERLRDRLQATREIVPDVFIASTLPRARQTAEIIAPAFAIPVTFDDEVQEMRVGEADGMPNEEAWKRYGTPQIEHDPFRSLSPGGESWSGFVLRVAQALRRITRQHEGKTIVIVCHGGVVDSSFIYFFGLNSLVTPTTGFYTHNTSITHWQHYQGSYDERPRWRLLKYNDTFHLNDIGVSESLDWRSVTPRAPTGPEHTSVPLPTEESDKQ